MKLLFLRRQDCGYCDSAEQRLRELFDEVHVVQSRGIGDKLPDEIRNRDFDAVFALRSHIIIPKWLIDKVDVCLNFHPGPPERPGIGCVNFALMEGDAQYGATCHYVTETIDAGPIVSAQRFPITDADDVATLLNRSYEQLLQQLCEVAPAVAKGDVPEPCAEKWTRQATRKRDMDKLLEIPLDIDPGKMRRQIRATTFGAFRPYIVLNGARFEFKGFLD